MDGDEMTRIFWKSIKDKLIFPFLDWDIKYFDLGLTHRDATMIKLPLKRTDSLQEHSLPHWTKPICIGKHAFGDQYRATDTVIKGPGKLKLLFVPEGKDEMTELELHNFTGEGGVAIAMHNTDESICAFVEASMNTAYEKKVASYNSTKNTLLNKYDGRFKDIFQEVYDALWKSKYEAAGIWYEHHLIDDMVAYAFKSEGGYVWASKNYDGDVQSDFLAQEAEPVHGAVTRHYRVHQKSGETSTNSIASIFVWTRELEHKAKLDDNFTQTLEEACIETVESGKMTKDLALVLNGPNLARNHYLNTEEFIDVVAAELNAKLS
ncbi:putative isocitrate dehydrogenase (NADP(+)) [Rosa chinensis]|uniref:Putative isocitrate dehydrogenase (NADP(+)) n=1 Tax=Rosa chinensis TaxID=74649 RepID=A0A2P6S7Q9_ROSCH|nr:putative isocitrate dehydrogenase (NADP(+)) [Rosa chinensis]